MFFKEYSDSLSDIERLCIEHKKDGLSTKEIGDKLGVGSCYVGRIVKRTRDRFDRYVSSTSAS